MNTVIEQQQETWPLTHEVARDYIDFAIEYDVPVSQLREEPYFKRIMAKAEFDTEFFALVFMAESFDEIMSWQRQLMFRMVSDSTIPFLAMCVWRGCGKTAICIALSVQSICFRKEKFIMYVGKSYDHASRVTENIKAELFTNVRIRKVFGLMKQRSASEMTDEQRSALNEIDYSISTKGWFACDPVTGEPFCFVLPKGCNQQVRGMIVRILGRMQRCTLIVIDDLEDDEEVLNEELRRKTRKWFNGSLLPCVPRVRPSTKSRRWYLPKQDSRPPWRIIYIDTLKHEDANMAHIFESSRWRKKVLPQCEIRTDEHGKKQLFSCVPELITNEEVRAEYRYHKNEGNEGEFFREYMCLAVNPIDAIWTRELFEKIHYSDDNNTLNRAKGMHRFIICDPARTSNTSSCPTAAIAFAKNTKTGDLYLRRELNDRMEVNDIPRKVLELAIETNTRLVAIEVDGGDDWIREAFFNTAAAMGIQVQFLFINAPRTAQGNYGTGVEGRKRRDAVGMGHYYKNGKVWHDISIKDGPLEMGLLTMPNPRRWDSIDCLGHVPRVMKEFGIYDEPTMDNDRVKFQDEEGWDELSQELERAARASAFPTVYDASEVFASQRAGVLACMG